MPFVVSSSVTLMKSRVIGGAVGLERRRDGEFELGLPVLPGSRRRRTLLVGGSRCLLQVDALRLDREDDVHLLFVTESGFMCR